MFVFEIEQALEAERKKIKEARKKMKALHEQMDVVQKETMLAERQANHERVLERGRKQREEDPIAHEKFMQDIKQRHRDEVIEGWLDGWWDLDDNFEPIQMPQVFFIEDFAEIRNPLMAHVMAKAGIFPSVGQARKNGWDKPLTIGAWRVTKRKLGIEVREKENA